MKKCSIKFLAAVFAVMCVLLSGRAFADVAVNKANFPDAAFRSYIRSKFGTTLTTSTIAAIKELDVSESGIYSLSGIEYFTALENLDCSNNKLTTLDLSRNTELLNLYCNDNKLTTLDLSSNTKLTRVDCFSNQLTSLNVSKNTALKHLDCINNRLTTLDVSNNIELDNLNCLNNQLTTLDVSNNHALRYLICGNNQLKTLDLSNNTGLYALNCKNNQLQPFSLSRLTKLNYLECDYTITKSGGMYYLNLTALKKAWGVNFTPADNDDVVICADSPGDSLRLSDLKDTSSGEYVVCFGTPESQALEYIEFDFGEDFELFVYPASGSSSDPADTAIAPSITTTELPPATVGTAYSFQLSVSASATCTVKGKLPAGLTMSSSGLISGTPTKQGTKKITLTAENSAGTAKKTLTFTVYAHKQSQR